MKSIKKLKEEKHDLQLKISKIRDLRGVLKFELDNNPSCNYKEIIDQIVIINRQLNTYREKMDSINHQLYSRL